MWQVVLVNVRTRLVSICRRSGDLFSGYELNTLMLSSCELQGAPSSCYYICISMLVLYARRFDKWREQNKDLQLYYITHTHTHTHTLTHNTQHTHNTHTTHTQHTHNTHTHTTHTQHTHNTHTTHTHTTHTHAYTCTHAHRCIAYMHIHTSHTQHTHTHMHIHTSRTYVHRCITHTHITHGCTCPHTPRYTHAHTQGWIPDF